MAKIVSASSLSGIADEKSRERFVERFIEDCASVVNGRLEFDVNIATKRIEVTFLAANVEQAIQHGLGRTPVGYFVVGKAQACDVYDGVSASSQGLIFLRSTATGRVTLEVF